MQRWIRAVVLAALVAVSGVQSATADDLRVIVRADWMFSLRAGVDWRIGRYAGIQSDIGTNLVSVVGDLCGVFYAMPADSRWQLNLLAGIPNAGIPLAFDSGMITLGGSAEIEYRFPNGVGLQVRLGEGFPLFFEDGGVVTKDISYPLNLWPDIAFGVTFSSGRRSGG